MFKLFVAVFALFACVCTTFASYGGAGYNAAPISHAGYAAQVQPAVSVSYLVPSYHIPISSYQSAPGYGAGAIHGSGSSYGAPQLARGPSAAVAVSSLHHTAPAAAAAY